MRQISKKRGFTIVELVIVIAVIAVLAAVLIPTFSNIVKKSHVSVDRQLVYHINEAVAIHEAENGKPKTAYEAIKATAELGFTIEKLTPTTEGYDIVWDSLTNRYALLDEKGEVVYQDDNKPYTPGVTAWKVYGTMPSVEKQAADGYSVYLKGTDKTGTVEVVTGFDAGDNIGIQKVNYTGNETSRDVVIRTNGSATVLTIDGENDTVAHYGEAGFLNIVKVDTESYHEHGYIPQAQIAQGRIVNEGGSITLENGTTKQAGVENLFIVAATEGSGDTAGSFAEIIVEAASGASVPTLDRSDVNIVGEVLVVEVKTTTSDDFVYLTKAGIVEQVVVTTEKGNTDTATAKATTGNDSALNAAASKAADEIANVAKRGENGRPMKADGTTEMTVEEVESLTSVTDVAVEEKASQADLDKGASLFAGGAGTKNNPYLIATDVQLAHIYNYLATNQGKYTYFRQTADITDFKDYSKTEYYYFLGEYDGGGHKITPASTVNKAVDLFDLYYGETTIKNLDLYSSDTTPVALAYSTYYCDTLNVENVNFYAMKDSTIHINAGNFGFVTRNQINDQRVNPAHGQVFNLVNVNNYVNVENSGNCTAAYFGSGCISCLSPSKGRTENATFIFDNCHNYGNISSALYAGVVWGNGSYNTYFGPTGDNISDEDMNAMVVFKNGGLVNHATISASKAHAFADKEVANSFILNATYQTAIGGSYVTVGALSGTYEVYFDGSDFKVNDNGATNTYTYKVALSVGSIYHYGTSKNVSNARKVIIAADEASMGVLFNTSKVHAYDHKSAVKAGIVTASASLDYAYECDGINVALVVKDGTLYIIFAEVKSEPNLFVDSAVSTSLYAYNQNNECVGSVDINQK